MTRQVKELLLAFIRAPWGSDEESRADCALEGALGRQQWPDLWGALVDLVDWDNPGQMSHLATIVETWPTHD